MMAVRHSWQRVWGCRPLSRVMEAEQETEIKTSLEKKSNYYRPSFRTNPHLEYLLAGISYFPM